jgi:hypothetical protein
MTDPERERIEALIESLDTICDRMKAAGLGRYVGRVREAIEQLRADHPAGAVQRPAPDDEWVASFWKVVCENNRKLEALMAEYRIERGDPPLADHPAQGEAMAEPALHPFDLGGWVWDVKRNNWRRIMPPPSAPAQTEATPAEQGGDDATAAAEARPLAAPATCPNCVDETDCSSVAICRAVDAVYATSLAAQAEVSPGGPVRSASLRMPR